MDLQNIFPYTVSDADSGERLDSILARLNPQVSRSRWTKLIVEGIFLVDSKTAKASSRLQSGQIIEIHQEKISQLKALLADTKESPWGAPIQFVSEYVPQVLFEDEHLIVLNKPEGLTVHPGAGVKIEETLVAWLLQEKKVLDPKQKEEMLQWGEQVLEEQRPGIVHRLDKGTSGCLVVAKHPRVHEALSQQFADKSAGRYYWAVVRGRFSEVMKKRSPQLEKMLREHPSQIALRFQEGGVLSVVSFLDRDPKNRLRFACVGEGGRKAITHISTLAEGPQYSLLELRLETGRTHQIRVHLSFLGFPILGDRLYSGAEARRVYLHAHTLYFEHPISKERLKFSAPWPDSNEALVKEFAFSVEL